MTKSKIRLDLISRWIRRIKTYDYCLYLLALLFIELVLIYLFLVLIPQRLADFFKQQQNTLLGCLICFLVVHYQRFTVFALDIMPYISASIIMQLFTVVSPKLEQLKKEGESGRRKINQYTRYGTVILGCFSSIRYCKMVSQSMELLLNPGFSFYFTATLTLVTGTMFLMWLGEQITERGVGNGISLNYICRYCFAFSICYCSDF